jgi:hypothetical protein
MRSAIANSRRRGLGFNVLSLSPAFWYDASVEASLLNGSDAVASNGETIKTILDRSGNGKNATQTTDGIRPILSVQGFNGKRTMYFATSLMTIATGISVAQPWRLFVVARCDLFGVVGRLLVGTLSVKTLATAIRAFSITVPDNKASVLASTELAGPSATLNPAVYEFLASGANSKMTVNGVSTVGNAGTNAWSSTFAAIGGISFQSTPFVGAISEIILVGNITDNRALQLRTYLNSKWNVSK